MTFKSALSGATILALAATPLMAQAPADPPAPPPAAHPHGMQHPGAMAKLSVTGEGIATIAPDMATITVGVSTRAETAGEAMTQNASQQQKVFDALKGQGIEDRDIQTSGLNLSPVLDYSQDGKPPVLTGYSAQNMVTIRVRDLAALGPTLDKLVETGANEINGISFGRDDMTAAEDEARSKAIQSAMHRAETMAAAAGMKLGRLVMLVDGASFGGPQPMAGMARAMKADSTPIAAGELSVNASVTATFALLPAEGDASGQAGDDKTE